MSNVIKQSVTKSRNIDSLKFVQIEHESSQVCNLQCKYCYIPKLSSQTKTNQLIIESIKNGTFVDYLKTIYDKDKLESYSLWGTEPTILIPVFIKYNFFETLLNEFPKLHTFSLSTNLIRNIHTLITFLEHVDELQVKLNRHINIGIQLSLDGIKEINDKNRILITGDENHEIGSFDLILETLQKLSEYYKTHEFKNIRISHNYKPTIDGEDIKWLLSTPEKLLETHKLFEYITSLFLDVNKNVSIQTGTSLTLAVPGSYTPEDGVNFQKLIQMLHDEVVPYTQSHNSTFVFVVPYVHDLVQLLSNTLVNIDTPRTRNNSALSCSQGDTMIGLSPDGQISICHSTFFFSNPEYLKIFLDTPQYQLKQRDFIKQYQILTPNINSPNYEFEEQRLLYVIRSYHDYLRMRKDTIQTQLLFTAKYGNSNVDKLLLEDKTYLQIQQLFLTSRFACPFNSIALTGTLHTQPQSIINIWQYGQFRKIFKYALDEMKTIVRRG